ncbi:MAG: NTP transferase domain-containing protein [Oscillospiraceae bacterium]|nr:NTP transferase domain-containing protein [Oscillospiraceae bacterium]
MEQKRQLKAVVLAAGKGTRLHDDEIDAPKVMREANGKPLLRYVLDAISFIERKDIILVVGYKKETVINAFTGYPYAIQNEQLGTGHAVMSAENQLRNYTGALLVCYGDMPAIKREVYEQLINTHFEEGNDCTLLTGESTLKMSFGRVERDENGSFLQVVEEKDCTPEQLEIKELNTGVYVFDTPLLLDSLKELKNDNSQGEYYITDVPAIMREKGAKIGILKRNLGDDIIGVNTVEQLKMVERILSLNTR